MRRHRYPCNWISPLCSQVNSFSFHLDSHVNRRRAIFHIPFQTIRRSRVPRRQLTSNRHGARILQHYRAIPLFYFLLLRAPLGAYVSYVSLRRREFHKNCEEKGGDASQGPNTAATQFLRRRSSRSPVLSFYKQPSLIAQPQLWSSDFPLLLTLCLPIHRAMRRPGHGAARSTCTASPYSPRVMLPGSSCCSQRPQKRRVISKLPARSLPCPPYERSY